MGPFKVSVIWLKLTITKRPISIKYDHKMSMKYRNAKYCEKGQNLTIKKEDNAWP